MKLQKIKDFDPDYRTHFEHKDLINYDLYAGTEKVGSVDDLLVDDTGKIRYLVIQTGVWIRGKIVLLPIGRARVNYANRSVIVDGFTRKQVEDLPQYDANTPVDYDYEEQVRKVYRPVANGATSVKPTSAVPEYDRNTYAYDKDPALYNLDDKNHQNLRLYQERLIANKTRTKTGEVAVTKRVETEVSKVSIPIEKERVVIERITPSSTTVTPDDKAFQAGEVARMEVYQETPDIHKETFVREEVKVTKEVKRETVNSEEVLRREEVDIDKQGESFVEAALDPNPPQPIANQGMAGKKG